MPKNKTDNKPCWSSYVNKTTETLDILLHDIIGFWGDDSKNFAETLAENKDRVINIDINSPGGSVHDGISMFNMLKTHEAPINITVSGNAASIASVIAMAGDKPPKMFDNTTMMIHKPSIGMGGNADEMAANIEILNMLQDNIIKAYKRHSNLSSDELNNMVNKTTWMNSDMAEGFGLAESIPESVKINNFYNFSDFGYPEMPEEVANRYKNEEIDPEKTIVDKVLTLLKPTIKEPEGMKQEEFENKISDLEAINQALETEKNEMSEKITALETENEGLKEADAKRVEKALDESIESFVDGLIADCKLAPVDKEITVKKLKALNGDNELFENEKKILENADTVVETGHIAENTDSHLDSLSENEKELEALTEKKLAENSGMSYRDALNQVRAENPKLVNEEK